MGFKYQKKKYSLYTRALLNCYSVIGYYFVFVYQIDVFGQKYYGIWYTPYHPALLGVHYLISYKNIMWFNV